MTLHRFFCYFTLMLQTLLFKFHIGNPMGRLLFLKCNALSSSNLVSVSWKLEHLKAVINLHCELNNLLLMINSCGFSLFLSCIACRLSQ